MKKSLSLFLSMIFLSSQFGCATVVNGGRKEEVAIRSNPAGSTAYIDGVAMGVTPFVVDLSHRKRHEVKFAKTGYRDETRSISRTFNWWVLGNLFLGGLPIIIDLAYGNEFKFDSDELNGVLVPLSKSE